MDLVGRDRPTERFQIEFPDGSHVDGVLDGPVDVLTDQDLSCRGDGTEPRGKVRHRPKRP
jgi:hypothetical protein